MMGPGRSSRMTTSVERVFRPLRDGLYQECILHYIHFIDPEGKILSSKLDKTIKQGLWYRARNVNEHSRYGETEYQFPGEDNPVRMLALGREEGDFRYGRF